MSNKRAAGLLEAGVWLQMAGDVDGARDVYRQALALEPDNARAKRLFLAAGGVLTEPKKEAPPAAAAHSRYEPPPRQEPAERRDPPRHREPPRHRDSPPPTAARHEPEGDARYQPKASPSPRHEPDGDARYQPKASPSPRHEPRQAEAERPEPGRGEVQRHEPARADGARQEAGRRASGPIIEPQQPRGGHPFDDAPQRATIIHVPSPEEMPRNRLDGTVILAPGDLERPKPEPEPVAEAAPAARAEADDRATAGTDETPAHQSAPAEAPAAAAAAEQTGPIPEAPAGASAARSEPAPEAPKEEPPAPAPAPEVQVSRGNEATRIISLAELEQAVARTTPAPADKAEQVQALLKEADECKAQGDLDKASGLVLRALVMDGGNLDAHEAAYVLLDLQGRTQAAEAELVHLLKLCADRHDVERGSPYLLKLVRLRPNDPETLSLARRLGSPSVDPNATLPATADSTVPRPGKDPARTVNDDPTATRPGRNKRNGERPFGRRRR